MPSCAGIRAGVVINENVCVIADRRRVCCDDEIVCECIHMVSPRVLVCL
jgi:hypothetical protein